MTRRFVGVGVGPGDPELVTLRAVRVLREADVVFVPVASTGEVGRAESVVLEHAQGTPVRRLPFSMSPAEGERERSRDAAAAAVARALESGGTGMVAAFATIGDPSVYSTFTYLAERLRGLLPEVDVEAVPGIMAMQDLAARSGGPLVVGAERLVLLPLVEGLEGLQEALTRYDTVVCYKGGARMPEVVGAIDGAGRLGEALYGAHLGLPDERICPASEIEAWALARAPYLSTVIVRAPRRARAAREGAR